ncbi:glycoprotein endo-alpha-1,2-mannosidase [Cimex lectularius]|uniref:Glycoprotein endo-alpha-1,2-mannosidase n=1 Tax=Cimex lectularius TaxID=79782 RepID=A0A8I6RRF7_CIMLE|nr:glycoprotein endo-alpha-1,2-mannosidase [Cimex lectularius]
MLKFKLFRVYLRTVLYIVITCLTVVFLLKIWTLNLSDNPYLPKYEPLNYANMTMPTIMSLAELKVKWIERKISRLSGGFAGEKVRLDFEPVKQVDSKIHAFYYSWYRNEKEDGIWKHWFATDKYPGRPSEFRTAYYPRLGFYSSHNKSVIDIHMMQMKKAGIGVAIVSWEPHDPKEILMKTILDTADKYTIKIALHWKNTIEINQIITNLNIFIDTFGQHNALYRIKRASKDDKFLPVIYIFDPFIEDPITWSSYLNPNGNRTIRNSQFDAIFLGLLSSVQNRIDIKQAHFDGFYTYFATNGFTYGSSWRNWKTLGQFADKNGLIFVPCIAPGYNDGTLSTYFRPRLNGNYYEIAWKSALAAKPSAIAINSFNSWEEGSQIEPAVPNTTNVSRFSDYEKVSDNYYLQFTGFWVKYATENNKF